MRVLILAGQFYPKIVGSGTATFAICNELVRRGCEVDVILDKEYELLLKNEVFSFTPIYINDYANFATGKASFKSPSLEVYPYIKDNKYDIIHVYSYLPMLLLSLMGTSCMTPVFFTFWNTPYRNERTTGYYPIPELDINLAKKIIRMNAYQELILGSKCNYNSAISLGANKAKTSFCYHGVDLKMFAKNLKESKIKELDKYLSKPVNNKDVIVALPGRLVERKGIFEALEAISYVNKRFDVKLLLTGYPQDKDTPFAQEVIAKSKSLNIYAKLILPKKIIPNNLVAAIYKMSNLVIAPSHYEGLGLTVVEALLAERPVVATDVQGINEVAINGVNALLVPQKDCEKLAGAIVSILEDKALAQKLAKNGPQTASKFTSQTFVDYILSRYTKIKHNYSKGE